MTQSLIAVAIRSEPDVVTARQRARQVAGLLGFERQDQTRIATAVSEIARNAFSYAGGGRVEFVLEGQTAPQLLIVRVIDSGPGIENLAEILGGRYESATGMGLGILGAHRLMDRCDIHSGPGGTEVRLKKLLPDHVPLRTRRDVANLSGELARKIPGGALQELQEQNQELLRTLAELRERQDDLLRLNHELEDTNRGVVALYAELDEKAQHLRRADEMKSRFLSNMSHEFRTPLNSIKALSRLLLDHIDGPLSAEQEKQVRFIVNSAENLTELVDDLLDLAKIEAGKTDVRPIQFTVDNLFSALRGMLRPLLAGEQIALVFEDPSEPLVLHTDEGKLSQILRNFISNAIKFTERGEVRVAVEPAEPGMITIAVADTGIGIAPEDQAVIFDEFTQVQNRLQSRTKGTGLGLPLCRRLATLLCGKITVESRLGIGSTFRVTMPVYLQAGEAALHELLEAVPETGKPPVLVVDDEVETLFLIQKYLAQSPFQFFPARTLHDARGALERFTPRAILLDVLLKGEESWQWLGQLKSDPRTRSIPVIVVSTVDDERKGLALGADSYLVKPVDRETLLAALELHVHRSVLVIDDDPAARYLVQKVVSGRQLTVLEAVDGRSGLQAASESRPALIFLDLQLPDMPGEEILRILRSRVDTSDIPVAILTASVLSTEERLRLERQAQAVVQKSELSTELAHELLTRNGL